MTAMFKVVAPGTYTTVQDEGRFGWQQFGVPPAGMLDSFAGRLANMLVGNPDGAALLELTFTGPTLAVLAPAQVAVTGAAMPLRLNGASVPQWQSFDVMPGDELKIGMAQNGCRAYLAVTRGIDVPQVMNSRSCYVGAALGGFRGRPLQAGDVLRRGPGAPGDACRQVTPDLIPTYPSDITLRAIPGPQDRYFDEGLAVFFNAAFTVSPQANRMGCRLQGPAIERLAGMPTSIISEPSLPGGVQIPADGQPIILLTEQTVGGYAKIATVISADIPRVAQAMPGDTVRFARVGIAAAHEAYRARLALLERIRESVKADEGPAVARNDLPDWNSEAFVARLIARLRQI